MIQHTPETISLRAACFVTPDDATSGIVIGSKLGLDAMRKLPG